MDRDLSNLEDTIILSLDRGEYNLMVSGIRDRQQPSIVDVFRGRSFDDICLFLQKYHFDCLTTMIKDQKRDGSIYTGSGSDRSEYRSPWMVKWKGDYRCELPSTQEKLFDGIIEMHNHYVSLVEDNERLRADAVVTSW